MLWWKYQQLRSSDMNTRLAAVAKLAESKDSGSVEPLLFALKDATADVRSAATLALAQFQDSRSVEPVSKLLRDPVAMVRVAAAQTLGKLQSASVFGALVGALGDADAEVRLCAARSLDQLGWLPEDDAARKAHILASGNLERVADLGAEGIAPLAEYLQNGPPAKQLAAVKALRGISDPRIPKLMQDALGQSSVMVKLAALETLELMADPDAYKAVERLFKDKSSNIRAAAISTAASCDGPRGLPQFLEMLKDTSWEVRLEAVKAVGRLGDPVAVEGLCRALQDRDHDVRESAAQALSNLGDARAIPHLVVTLLDPQSFVRTAAHNALYRIDRCWKKSAAARSVLPQIKAAVNHREYWVSHNAAKLVEQIQPDPDDAETDSFGQPLKHSLHPAFSILADLLRDPDRDLRLAAAAAFGELGEADAVPLLTHVRPDEDELVRQAAGQSLAALN